MSDKVEIVKTLLKNYRNFKSDYEQLCSDLLKYQAQLILHEKGKIESMEEVVLGLSLQASVITDIPKSETNKFSSVTENTTINYLYYLCPSPMEIKAIKRTIGEKARVLNHLNNNIRQVERLVAGLNDKEQFIARSIYFGGYNRPQTLHMFNKQFPECLVDDKSTIWKYEQIALKKMAERI